MWTMILAGAMLAAAPAQQQMDTTVAVDPKARLRMENVRGDVVIHTWDKPQLRVHSSDSDEDFRLRVAAGASSVTVGLEPMGGHVGRPPSADLELTIPATMGIALTGSDGDVKIEGAAGEVSVETVHGDVVVSGGAGLVQLQSVQGDITLSGATARVEIHAVNGDIHLHGITGDVVAETMSGDVSLDGIDARTVQISAVSGDLSCDGTVKEGGHYSLKTHSGDVTFGMPQGAGATIDVSTFTGDFQADIPVQLTEQSKSRHFSFTLGSGGARVELESFSGDIRLARSGFAGKR